MNRLIGTSVILAVCLPLVCRPEAMARQTTTKTPLPVMGTISGRVYFHTCQPWDGISFLDNKNIFLMTYALSPTAEPRMESTKCCIPARPGCPLCPGVFTAMTTYDTALAVYGFDYKITGLASAQYKIVLAAADSLGFATKGQQGEMHILAYARSRKGYAPDQADSSAARVLIIDKKRPSHSHVNIYYAQEAMK